MFIKRGKDKKEKKKKNEPSNMWDLLKMANKEVPVQEKRIADKKLQLEDMGGQIDTSHLKKPETPNHIHYEDENKSMWKTMKLAEQKIKAYMDYLNKLEKAYDNAIANVKIEGPPSKKEEEKVYTEKKVIIEK